MSDWFFILFADYDPQKTAEVINKADKTDKIW